ncbi:MAG: MFS transporter [Polyangiales bacterium]
MPALPRDFYLFLVSRFASATAMTMLRAAIGWHVFELSHSAFYLGLVGIVQFVPVLGLTLLGGAVADSHDRRRVINMAQLVLCGCGSLLLYVTRTGHASLPWLYTAVAGAAAAGAFEAPARSALLPALVGRDRFARAVTIASTNTALAFASGPALGGVLIARFGIGSAYTAYLVLVALGFTGVASLKGGGDIASRNAISIAAIREGVAFVIAQPVILGCMSLDMFAVIFGGATALLPIYAKQILHAGAGGYGMLTSSFEVGALAMSLVLVLRPPARNAGPALLSAVAVFGVATIVFGSSRLFPLSIAAYLLAGMADQISVVMRSTAIQLSTPDALRGRVSAVNMIFIGASNQLGAAESGFVAHLTSPTFSVVSGGIACLIVVAMLTWRMPALRRYQVS